jgi:hypothetical protein
MVATAGVKRPGMLAYVQAQQVHDLYYIQIPDALPYQTSLTRVMPSLKLAGHAAMTVKAKKPECSTRLTAVVIQHLS